MKNDKIADIFKLTAQLLELHEADAFRVKAYLGAVYQIDRIAENIALKDTHELMRMGFTQNMAAKIVEVATTKTLKETTELLAKTPAGVVEMLHIKGLGVKKVHTLWKELQVTTLNDLQEACKAGKVAQLKGFGEKTQENILEAISFQYANSRKLRYDKAEKLAKQLKEFLANLPTAEEVHIVGELRRQMEVIHEITIVVSTKAIENIQKAIAQETEFITNPAATGVFVWRGSIKGYEIPIAIHCCTPEKLTQQLLILSANEAHLSHVLPNGKTVLQAIRQGNFKTEEDFFQHIQQPYLPAYCREGLWEFDKQKQSDLPNILQVNDLKGCLHNHSTYSDGRNTLKEMALACKNMGLSYFGIADHSQTAVYAQGLEVHRVLQQFEEIDQLNKELYPFKILKGIESDILVDGSLDYEDDLLSQFDYVVASIHASLKMDKDRATERVLKAIANPYTTILGHPTARLLLKREGYDLDYEQIAEACATHDVAIELNANPYRLDLDWRFLQLFVSKGVKVAINPDAHGVEELVNMRYGVQVAQKGLLTANYTLNAMSQEEFLAWLQQRKKNKLAKLATA
jgi:DNA polymerase (family 10)